MDLLLPLVPWLLISGLVGWGLYRQRVIEREYREILEVDDRLNAQMALLSARIRDFSAELGDRNQLAKQLEQLEQELRRHTASNLLHSEEVGAPG